MGPKGLKRLCHGCLVNFVFYANGASMAKSQIGVNRCLQTFKHGLRKSVRPSSFQKAQLQSVSIFFKFVDCLAPFAFAVLLIFPSFLIMNSYFHAVLSFVTVPSV